MLRPMLGRAAGRHGSCCGGPPGPDCADFYKGKKRQRAYEKRQWQKEEDMEWRPVRAISVMGDVGAELKELLKPNNHAVEGCLQGTWLSFRCQETPEAEIFEFSVPAIHIAYVAFYVEEDF